VKNEIIRRLIVTMKKSGMKITESVAEEVMSARRKAAMTAAEMWRSEKSLCLWHGWRESSGMAAALASGVVRCGVRCGWRRA